MSVLVVIGCSRSLDVKDTGESRARRPDGYGAVEYEPEGSPTRYAIVIGIDEYEDNEHFPRLKCAVNDAASLRNVLRDEFGFAEDCIRFLANSQASKAEVQRALDEWLPQRKPKRSDAVLLYFAGHATRDGQLACADSDGERLIETGFSVTDLVQRLESIACGNKAVILDSCFSGTLFIRRRPDRANERRQSRREDSVFFGISSAREDEFAADRDGDGEHSIFTGQLLQQLRERVDSKYPDHRFNLKEVAVRLESHLKNAPSSYQKPTWGYLDTGRGDFVFRPTYRRVTPTERIERRRYAATIQRAQQLWMQGELDQVRTLLRAQEPQSSVEDLRSFEWHYLSRLCDVELAHLETSRQAIGCLAFSPDGSIVAYGGFGDSITLWDWSSKTQLGSLPTEGLLVNEIEFRSDANTLVSITKDGLVQVWDITTHEELSRFSVPFSTSIASFSKGGDRIAVEGERDTIHVWNVVNGKRDVAFEVPAERITAIEFSQDGANIIIATSAGKLRLHDAESGRPGEVLDVHSKAIVDIGVLSGRERVSSITDRIVSSDGTRLSLGRSQRLTTSNDVTCIAVSSNGDRVAIGTGRISKPGEILLADLEAGRIVAMLPGHRSEVTALRFSEDGQYLASASPGCIRLWNAELGDELAGSSFVLDQEGMVGDLEFSADGRRIATGASGGRFRIWDIPRPPKAHRNDNSADAEPATKGRSSSSTESTTKIQGADKLLAGRIAYAPQRRHMAATIGSGEVAVWEMSNGKKIHVLKGHGPDTGFTGLEFTGDGKFLASANLDGTVRVWDVQTGDQISCIKRKGQIPLDIASCGDGSTLAVAYDEIDIEEALGVADTSFNLSNDLVRKYLFMLISGTKNAVVLWDCKRRMNRLVIETPHGHWLHAIAASPDGRRIATAGWTLTGGRVKVWDALTGDELLTLRDREESHLSVATGVAFSEDGRRLAGAFSRRGSPGGSAITIWSSLRLHDNVATHQ
jgi:WD40 repeat protein